MSKKIGIDIDGVCADFDTPFAKLLTQVTGKPCLIQEPTEWEWPRKLGFTKAEESEAWRWINENPTWWMRLHRYDDAMVRLDEWEAAGVEFYFITARQSPFARNISTEWVKGYYRLQYPVVLTTKDKGLACKALGLHAFIDDKPEHAVDIRLYAPKTHSYLRKRKHNLEAQRFVEQDGVILTDSLTTFCVAELAAH